MMPNGGLVLEDIFFELEQNVGGNVHIALKVRIYHGRFFEICIRMLLATNVQNTQFYPHGCYSAHFKQGLPCRV